MNWRTWAGVLTSALVAAAGTLASTFVVGACYLVLHRRNERLFLAELRAQEDEARRLLAARLEEDHPPVPVPEEQVGGEVVTLPVERHL